MDENFGKNSLIGIVTNIIWKVITLMDIGVYLDYAQWRDISSMQLYIKSFSSRKL